MNRVVLLDTGPLGLVTHPKRSPQSVACSEWLYALTVAGVRVLIPELADYELRRELLRARKAKGLARLDELAATLEYLPLTTEAMRQAAAFWAQARQHGVQTADDKAIDGDVILAAQAATCGAVATVVATTNVGHLDRFTEARSWSQIVPES